MLKEEAAGYQKLIGVSLLILLGWLAFGGALACDFVVYDDAKNILANPHIQSGLSPKGILWALIRVHNANWYPMTWLSHMTDISLYGLNPEGHHLTSVLIHLLNGTFLFLLLAHWTSKNLLAWIVAALFLIHPMRAESVVWISERKDTLCVFFWLAALYFYGRWTKTWNKQFYWMPALAFLFGFMAKPMIVTLPVMLLLLDYWPFRIIERSRDMIALISEKKFLFLLTAAFCAVTYMAQQTGDAILDVSQMPLGDRLHTAVYAYSEYIFKLFWPVNLTPIYPPLFDGLSSTSFVLRIVFLLGLTVCCFYFRKKLPMVWVGWLWWVLTLLPVVGLIKVGVQSMADRYTYFPCVGLWIAVVWSLEALLQNYKIRKSLLWMLGLVVLGGLVISTQKQAAYWYNSRTLFGRALEIHPDNYRAFQLLADDAVFRGDKKSAIGFLQKSDEAKPGIFNNLFNLGHLLQGQGRHKDALRYFSRALAEKPNDLATLESMAASYEILGYSEQAKRHLQLAEAAA